MSFTPCSKCEHTGDTDLHMFTAGTDHCRHQEEKCFAEEQEHIGKVHYSGASPFWSSECCWWLDSRLDRPWGLICQGDIKAMMKVEQGQWYSAEKALDVILQKKLRGFTNKWPTAETLTCKVLLIILITAFTLHLRCLIRRQQWVGKVPSL